MSAMAQRVAGLGVTIFTEMTRLAQQHGAVNLGQGFPDFAAPDFLKEAAAQAVAADINQYAPANGRPRLRAALAHTYARHYGLDYDPEREIVITHGATEGIFAAIMGLVNPGDEVILFEPYYDSYVPSIHFAGGRPRYYTLRPPDWRIDPDALAALFSPHTRLLILNTPHNPTGKVFSADELALIARLCRQHDVIALVDEVYEHILFDRARHVSLAGLPGMRQRTVTVSSLGKSFSVTGWKVGWAVAPPELCQALFRAHQFVTFCGAAPLQEAAADALMWADETNYYAALATLYAERRTFLLAALTAAGLTPLTPQGTYFVMVDIGGLGFADDVAFCRWLTSRVGVAAIPPSAFYHNAADGRTLARFAFCKSQATLDAAAQRLQDLRRLLPV